ncbi:MAG: glutamate synthase [Bdellovibrio sp.]|nr:MAG: glutamate synthase [Bdellovibrio sp.]
MRISRAPAIYRPARERVHDDQEFLIPHDAATVTTQAKRCMDCGVPFCQSPTPSGCPLGNFIPDWNRLVAAGQWAEAVERLHATNNFPEFTSRLCPAPCESACVLGLYSEPVTIKSIERAIVDFGFEQGLIRPKPPQRLTGKRVAVVGSGPAGLACAQQLARQGHSVTVFEKADRLGGLLRYGIPDFKMAKTLIDRRLNQLRGEGVNFLTGVHVGSESHGREICLRDLKDKYDAVALTIGAEAARDLPIPGRNLKGIRLAMDYLTEHNRRINGELVSQPCARGKDVIVIGGGDTGSDCVGTALRQGAKSVLQLEIQPRPPSEQDPSTPWPYWPFILRSSHVHEEGGKRDWSIRTQEFLGDESGHVRALRVEKISSGELTLDADLVLLALGFTGSGAAFPELARTPRGEIHTDERFMTSLPGVFAAGDARRGASLIVWAIAEGRELAARFQVLFAGHSVLEKV